jgi:hypothetical protein
MDAERTTVGWCLEPVFMVNGFETECSQSFELRERVDAVERFGLVGYYWLA